MKDPTINQISNGSMIPGAGVDVKLNGSKIHCRKIIIEGYCQTGAGISSIAAGTGPGGGDKPHPLRCLAAGRPQESARQLAA